MLVSFECTVVAQRLRNLSDVRSLQAPKQVGAGRWGAGVLGSLPGLEHWHQTSVRKRRVCMATTVE